ncbi:MAG: type II toxin-antitoxin system VapC family toxin [candidate division KSB1 bacterium]|nr:type II toxin-antitoxin system VapC family toxin [candidate division KSB1 bacterium]
MNYLLDTHTLLWVLFEDEKLSEKAKETISNPENRIFVSLISYFEISLKYSLGKIELENITPDEIPDRVEEVGIETLEVTEKEAASFYKLPKAKHKDPFDRLIIWQAISKNMALISKDQEMSEYQKFGLKVLWN